jgi:hypothetical protein
MKKQRILENEEKGKEDFLNALRILLFSKILARQSRRK